MRKITYNGDIKIIKKIVELLNRKVPTPLDSDGNAKWGTNGQMLVTDGTGSTNWVTPPAAQVQSDWNEADNTKADYIKNKPTIPAAQIQSDWTQADNTQADYIKNKPTIPTVNDGTLTIQQNGTTVGTFSANQSGDTTVNLTGGGGSGGHTIEDASGTDMDAEDNLQFADAKVTDDSGNSRTKVEVIRPITESQVSSITEDGVYVVTDGQQISINAANVAYNGGSVAGALNALNSVTDIDSLVTKSSSYTFSPYKFSQYGKIVVLSFQAIANTNFAANTLNQVATLDSSIRPSTNRFSCFICSDSGGAPITSANCLLFTDGKLCIVPISQCRIAAGTIMYSLD